MPTLIGNTTQWFRERSPTLTKGSEYIILAALIACEHKLRDIITRGANGEIISWWNVADVLLTFIMSAAVSKMAYTDKTHGDWLASRRTKTMTPEDVEAAFLEKGIREGQTKAK